MTKHLRTIVNEIPKGLENLPFFLVPKPDKFSAEIWWGDTPIAFCEIPEILHSSGMDKARLKEMERHMAPWYSQWLNDKGGNLFPNGYNMGMFVCKPRYALNQDRCAECNLADRVCYKGNTQHKEIYAR